MMNRNIFQFAVIAILSSLASACGTTELLPTKNMLTDSLVSSDFNNGNPINKLGFVEYAQRARGNSTYLGFATAEFFEHSWDVTSELGEMFHLKNGFVTVNQDACHTNDWYVFKKLRQGRWPIRAGNDIHFMDDNGGRLSIDTTQGIVGPDEIVYKSSQQVSKDLVGDLLVDIPGDDFPQFANQKMPSSPSVKDLKADNNFLDFSWTPSSHGGYLTFTFIITPDVNSKSFYVLGCDVTDDGSFSLTDTEHGSGARELILVAALKTRVVRKNQSVLFLHRKQHFSPSDL